MKEGETGGLDVAFRNLIYDYYSREASKKIRLAHRQLAESGKFCSAQVLYGYRKSETDKHKLEIEPETAKVVREIFDMRLAGMRVTEIARNLNERGIECPAARHIRRKETSSWNGRKDGLIWVQGSVDWILCNEQYTGTFVAQKQKSTEICGRHLKVPEEEWVKVEGAHEAIISKEEYAKVKSMYRTKGPKRNFIKNIYRCGYCGRKMNGQLRGGSMYCMAGTLSSDGECKKARIKNEAANEAVLMAIQHKVKLCRDAEETRQDEEVMGVQSISE